MYKHILIPTDGTELGTLALKQGLAFAKGIGAKITCVTAYPPLPYLYDGSRLPRRYARTLSKKRQGRGKKNARSRS